MPLLIAVSPRRCFELPPPLGRTESACCDACGWPDAGRWFRNCSGSWPPPTYRRELRGIAGKSGLLTKHAQWAPASSECGSLERRPERLAGRACRNSWMFHVRSFSDAYGVSCRVRAEKSLGHRWVATPQGHTGGQLPGFPVPATGLLLGIRRGAGFGFPRRCAPVGTHGKHTGAAVSYV